MKQLILICFCALALLSTHAFGAEQAHNIKVRVVCGIDVPGEFKITLIPGKHRTYFDVPMSLKTFADDIPPKAFLDAVAEQTASRYTQEWIGYLSIIRWSAADQRYLRIERIQLRDTKAFLSKLQDGDVLAFHGQFCRF